MAPPVLEVLNVSKAFERKHARNSNLKAVFSNLLYPERHTDSQNPLIWALRDVSFSVNQGEVLGIIGPNGAGKSTLLKLIAGVMRPTFGKIYTKGQVVSILELGLGFQPDLSGRDNVLFNGQLHGLSRKEISLLIEPILDYAELSDFADEPLKNFSSGMQMRLAFSIATHIPGEILIFDEVFGVGDEAFRSKTFHKLEELVHQSRTIILVSHNLNEIAYLCSSVIILENGYIQDKGTAYQMVEKYAESVFLHTLTTKSNKEQPISESVPPSPEAVGTQEQLPGESQVNEDILGEILKNRRSWNDEDAPSHKSIVLNSIEVLPYRKGQIQTIFETDCDLKFTIQFTTHALVEFCDFVIILRKISQSSIIIIHSGLHRDFNRKWSVGKHTVFVEFPNKMLNKGYWVVNLQFVTELDKEFSHFQDLVGFRIRPNDSWGDIQKLDLPSGFVPELEWKRFTVE